MDDLAFLRERIESYADYTIDTQRHLTDEQIRAYAGEALARILERLAPAGVDREALEATLLRCEFADQLVIRALDALDEDTGEVGAIHRADRAVVELADGADAVDGAALGLYVAALDAALTARANLLVRRGAAPQITPAPDVR